MKRYSPLSLVFILSLIFAACGANYYVKKAKKFDDAGLYRDAAEMYYQAAKSNRSNVDAKLGLKRTGQLVLRDLIDKFYNQYKINPIESVYLYLDAENYYNNVNAVGVMLDFPPEYKEMYIRAKEMLLANNYAEATKALEVENFTKAESLLGEILNLDANYKDSQEKWNYAKYEPIYRTANQNLNVGKNRSAYYGFDEITRNLGSYKESSSLRQIALNRATITIWIAPFYHHPSNNLQAQVIRTKTASEIDNLKSPFYQIINDTKMEALFSFNQVARPALVIQLLKTLGIKPQAKAILFGNINQFQAFDSKMNVVDKKGYQKTTEKQLDANNREVIVDVTRPIYYREYEKESIIKFSIEFFLMDMKTGEIMATNVFQGEKSDWLHYATFDGDYKSVVPGYWKDANVKSPEDRVETSSTAINNLQALFNGKRDMVSLDFITDDIIGHVAKDIALSVNKYNPER